MSAENSSEIGHGRLRYGQGNRSRKEGVRILGAAVLREWTFRCAGQLCKAVYGNLAHRRLILAEALNGVPGRRICARVLDVNVRLQHVAVLDQVEALDHVKLLGVRRSESVQGYPIVDSDRVDDERIAFVTADGFAIPGCFDVRGMLVCQVDAANVVKAGQYHDHFLLPLASQ